METLHQKKNSTFFLNRGSLPFSMTSVKFPKPTGFPQLIVTSKQAFVLDAHIQDKVIVSIKAPKPGYICGAPVITQRHGAWTLTIDGSYVYCYYYDQHVRAVWRAELAPKDSETITTIVLNSGFTPVGIRFEVIFLAIVVVFGVSMVIMDIGYLRSEVKERSLSLAERIDGLYPTKEEEVTVAGGPGGIQITHLNNVEVTDLKHQNVVIGDAERLDPTLTPKFRNFFEENTFKIGTELKHGESIQFSEYQLVLNNCLLIIKKPSGEGYVYRADTHMDSNCILTMQRDGNMVMYHLDQGAVWASKDHIGKLCPKGITLTKKGNIVCQN